MTQKIAIACDHGGLALKIALKEALAADAIGWLDLGADTEERSDYPDFSKKLVNALKAGQAARGILICGTGIGMSIAANRDPAIRAALCTDVTMARLAREHNDANVLCLGGRVIGPAVASDIVRTFLSTAFEGGRHVDRLRMIS